MAWEGQKQEWQLAEGQMCVHMEELQEHNKKQEVQLRILEAKMQETVQACICSCMLL